MITLRPYQEEPIQKAIEFFRKDNQDPALIVLPTAWGKSILAAYVAKYMPWFENLLVVQPSKELLEQNYNKFIMLCGDKGEKQAGIYSASMNKKEIKPITFATIGSIKGIGAKFRDMGFAKMLIDEAHLYPRKEESMLGQFLIDSGIKQVLGITATPLKLESFTEKQGEQFDKWSSLTMLTNPSPDGSFFKSILHVGQVQEMTGQKFWSPLLYEILPFDTSELRLNTGGSEFSEDSQEMAYRLNNIRANIFGALDYHKERKHCLVFVPTVEEAEILAAEYPNSAVVSGKMSKKDRAAIIDAFKTGRIRVIFNVSVLSVGFDYPGIDMEILAISTASVAKYYQILGRGVRIDPGKKDCIIVDMGANVQRFGKVEDIRFIYEDKWRMYGTNGILLTGIPISCLGRVNYQDIWRTRNWPNPLTALTFGKYKGVPTSDIPMGYKRWYIRSENTIPQVVDKFIAEIENYIHDTRNEPPKTIMPDGQHAGKAISDIPTGYLFWYYKNHSWNETNDSLRRGIEPYLQSQYNNVSGKS